MPTNRAAASDPSTAPPGLDVPAGAWDCHVHVFGPRSAFPLDANRPYTPLDALPADLERIVATLGIARFVLVQPGPYGCDNRRLLEALSAFGDRARGVVVLPPGAPDVGLLREWHALGVRGIWINLASGGAGPERLAEAFASAVGAGAQVAWHIELHVEGAALALLPPLIEQAPVPVVLDHFGRIRAGTPHEAADLRALEGLLARGRTWIKLSAPYRLADHGAGPADVTRVARALVNANPERLVWGSDWPHTGQHAGTARSADAILPFRAIDPHAQLDLLRELVPSDAVRARILGVNPQAIYQ